MVRVRALASLAASLTAIAAVAALPPLARAQQPAPAAAASTATPASPAAVKAAVQRSAPPQDAGRAARPASCQASAGLVGLGMTLRRVALRLAHGGPLKIIAFGSSSTAGAMASSQAATYPSRLAAYFKRRFPDLEVTVLNRGVGGEEAADMLKRLDKDVIDERPDLVLWQVGTNAVLRDHPVENTMRLVDHGIARIKETGADIVLIDPQYSPAVIAKPEAEPMVDALAAASKRDNVALFRRYAVMQQWRAREQMSFESFVSPDGLHMNDWGYDCWATLIGGAIVDATIPVTAVARTNAHKHP